LTLDDLADLDSEELVEHLSSFGLTDQDTAGDIIMAARAHWFDDEDAGDDAGDADEGDATDGASAE
jgi:N utilization substance protein A